MKLYLKHLLVVLVTFLCCTGELNISQITREVEIVVLDEKTEKPLSGIVVYYQVKKGQMRRFVDSTFFEINEKVFKTDKNGSCIIPSERYFKYPLNMQWISSDTISVNIDVSDNIKKQYCDEAKAFWSHFSIYGNYNTEMYFCKNINYKGYVVYSLESYLREEGEQERPRSYEKYDLLFNYNLTGSNKDRFVIRLKRK